MQDALDKLQIDKSSKHFNAYVNDCRRIIKRAMCSRRGYVKHEIGLKFKSKLYTEQMQFLYPKLYLLTSFVFVYRFDSKWPIVISNAQFD
jgi:hypothetical protein